MGSRVSATRMRRSNAARVRSQEGRIGAESVQRKRDKHDQDERVEGRNGSVPNEVGWYRGRGKGAERRGKSAE